MTKPDDTAAASPVAEPLTVTPGEARTVWEALERPTYTATARWFSDRGRPCSPAKVEYWHRKNWGTTDEEAQIDLCDRIMDLGLKTNFTPEDEDLLNLALITVSDAQMLRSAMRATLAATIKGSLAIARKSNQLAESSASSMGSGIQRSAGGLPMAIAGMQRLELIDQRATRAKQIEDKSESEVIDLVQVDEADPLAPEITAWSRAGNGSVQ